LPALRYGFEVFAPFCPPAQEPADLVRSKPVAGGLGEGFSDTNGQWQRRPWAERSGPPHPAVQQDRLFRRRPFLAVALPFAWQ